MTQVIDINELDIETIEDELLQAILICIFTDAAADESELPDYAKGQSGGWWGDKIETVVKGKQTSFSWGSKLWMLKRAKITADEAGMADVLLEECLSPLIEAGLIKENSVTAALKDNRLTLIVPLESENYEIKGLEKWLGL